MADGTFGGPLVTPRFSEPGRGSHMKGRLCRRCKPAGDDEGCEEVRPVAREKRGRRRREGGGGEDWHRENFHIGPGE